jgi:hypothetical protein
VDIGIMNNKKVFVYVLSLLILSSFTYAASFDINTILYPFRDINVAIFYLNYYAFIDAIIYLILFLSLTKLVFLKVYPNNKKEAKTVSVGIALVLTVSMTLVEMNTRFNLGMLQPVALLIFLLMIAILLYNLLHGLLVTKAKQPVLL